MTPPRQSLSWEEVVDYAFLANFDLLCDTRQDVQKKPWATPAARTTMDKYLKCIRASEEIERLNVEVRRFATFLYDEDVFLRKKENQLLYTSRPPARAVYQCRMEHACFNHHHSITLKKIYKLSGFTGQKGIGKQAKETSTTVHSPLSATFPTLQPMLTDANAHELVSTQPDSDNEFEEEQANEDEEVAALTGIYGVLTMAEGSQDAPLHVRQ
ncbi:hypothetical protein D9619_011313 [Psilocybe cf. subviscida]|uniref:Uncharacterized protein n=1 Tax=Psilocybe cf. subviscida TaxID=2480587 RepID=A0A8H5BLI7_9AGAR|nr:hypothetical protein D9619_011313 [Psilocybe cf. subviscida]